MEIPGGIRHSKRKWKGLLKDGAKSAEIINLVYVSDKDPGIRRVRRGNGFAYFKDDKKLSDKGELLRIKRLAIPPAWESVWICCSANGHLQATGFDARKRKQYRYHSSWSRFRNQTKFSRMLEFGRRLPAMRERFEQDLSQPGLPEKKVLAAVITIMQETSIRVGNGMYEKLYGSFGLTTLKDRHVKISGSSIRFCFKGKKGIYHEIDLKSRKIARIVKQCRDIPGRELFQYYNGAGERTSIDSGRVNQYLKEICCDDFTTKDFRTWMGTVYAIEALKELGQGETESEKKEKMVSAFDRVAQRLGNTRTVCRNYYVHPVLVELYLRNGLGKFLEAPRRKAGQENFSEAECTLIEVLETI